jgi:putative transposase
LFIPDIPVHVVVRGHNHQAIVARSHDYSVFIESLAQAIERYSIKLHAWVLMTNHLHVLLTAPVADSLPRTMQYLGARYGRYFNTRTKRTGALWDGRYRPSPVSTERYLLACYRYIELNPVRAGMVDNPEEYPWSSYHANALGITDMMVTPYDCYLALGGSQSRRRQNYRALFASELEPRMIDALRYGAKKGRPVGDAAFVSRIETLTQRDAAGVGAGVGAKM